MAGKLNGRVAVITGAALGQGAATARVFAEEGAKVVIADILRDEGERTAEEIGDQAFFHHLDIRKEEEWTALVNETTKRWGAIDILINNAGRTHVASILDLTVADFQNVLDINLIGGWLGIKAVAPTMITKGKGSIVNICSASGKFGQNGLSAYGASKWALRGLTRIAAMELGHRGVRVNGLYPGGVNTRMGNINNEDPAELSKYFRGQPIQRIGEPEEVARASLFLASDDASYICGAELSVDGGMTLGSFIDFLPGAPSE